jgi:phospholipid/cholesterol/gamma-HCH transport system permease protein
VAEQRELSFQRDERQALKIRLAGDWTLAQGLPPTRELRQAIEGPPKPSRVVFDARDIGDWDSALVAAVERLVEWAGAQQVPVDLAGLPPGVTRLVALATAVPERGGQAADKAPLGFVTRLGAATLAIWQDAAEFVPFVGESLLAAVALVRGKARMRTTDFFLALQDCGASALGIVALISMLVGLILAFVGAVQLQQFGATIYVADLVGIAMTREMGAMMTGIIMAGRTGASFAAQIGNMKVTEEIDALRTFGISPMEFLVMPRMAALFLMMPLLTLYADFVGILGGMIVGVGGLDLTPEQYLKHTMNAVSLTNFAIGIVKGSAFGVLVAVAGCLRGMQCGKDSAAVGAATTSAVVTSIVLIIVTDAIFTVVCNILGI